MAQPLVLVHEERQRLHEVITRCLAGESNTDLLEEAVQKGDKTTVLALLRLGMDKDTRFRYYGATPLIRAASNGHLAVVNALLKAGADVHLGYFNGWTALHEAALSGHKGVVIALLRAKADKNARDEYNETPLYRAAGEGHLPVVEILMAAGADLNVRGTGPTYATALERAIMNKHNHVVAAIVDHGADVNAQCHDDQSRYCALHYALDGEVVNILVGAGANVNLQTNEGETPLMKAAVRYNVGGLLILLQHGAKMNAKDIDGQTPLHSVCQRFNHEKPEREQAAAATTSLLLRWGADEAALDNDGKTPADLLPQKGADDVRLLLTRAPVDRAWRRRGWLIMLRLRSCNDEARATQRRRGGEDEGNVHLVMVVHKLLGVQEEGVFRAVVSYL